MESASQRRIRPRPTLPLLSSDLNSRTVDYDRLVRAPRSARQGRRGFPFTLIGFAKALRTETLDVAEWMGNPWRRFPTQTLVREVWPTTHAQFRLSDLSFRMLKCQTVAGVIVISLSASSDIPQFQRRQICLR